MAEYGITIRRVLDAPRERVWQEWTEPGGTWRATMLFGPDRRVIQWKGDYLEVVPPDRLVLTFSNSPDELYELVTVALNDLGAGRTEMLFEQRGHMRPEEYDFTRDGWNVFFDRLEARLQEPMS